MANLTELSPFTIEVEGEQISIPTYAISEEDAKDLLQMIDGSKESLDSGGFVQRWGYRWFVYDGTQWYSLRLVK